MPNPYVRCIDPKFEGGKPPRLATGAVYRKVKSFKPDDSHSTVYQVTCEERVDDMQTSGYKQRFETWEPKPGDQVLVGGAGGPRCDVLEVDASMFSNGKVGLRIHNIVTGAEDWIAVDPKDYGTSLRPILGRVPKQKGRIDPDQTLGDALHKSSADKAQKEEEKAAAPAAAPVSHDPVFDDLTDADRRMVNERIQRFHKLRADIPKAEKDLAAMKAEYQGLIRCGLGVN